jgi:16S rRNA (guanine(966)-N(2))-methyltransferase RsmD
MRIISGKYKSRRLFSALPSKHKDDENQLRPTTDRARETLFNMLNNIIDFEDLKCLDLFAGTGAVGFELLSRGASRVDFVENSFKQVSLIEKNSKELGCESKVNIFKEDVHDFLLKKKDEYYDLIFADPPYYNSDTRWLKHIGGLNFSVFVIESGGNFDVDIAGCDIKERKAGITNFKIVVSQNKD